jgi:protein-S-isoprenylcysteine O-methyltransferase Ste14
MELFLRWFLPAYLLTYLSTALLWRSYRLWKKTGVNPYVLGRTESLSDLVGAWFRLTLGGLSGVVVLYAVAPGLYANVAPIPWLQSPVLVGMGLILLLISLAWILIAQAQMGRSWRIGIETREVPPLIQHGLFKRSRNPIFLGTRVMLLGFFLVLPNAILFAVLLLGEALIQIQVRLEEEHLARVHGEPYLAYRRLTRRWL